MKKVVSFSGGRTSAYLCKIMIDTFGRENVDFIYMDTGAEHSKTYEFIRKVNHEFGLDLVCLRGDFSLPIGAGVGYNVIDISEIMPDLVPFSEMMGKYGVPYIGGMFCTDRMKLKPFKKYCDDTYGKKNYETWLGIREDEPARVLGKSIYKGLGDLGFNDEKKLSIYNRLGWDNDEDNFVMEECSEVELLNKMKDRRFRGGISYMAEISDFDKQDVLSYWAEMPFDLDIDEWSGNCLFCPKKSNLKLTASQRDNPVEYLDFWLAIKGGSVRVDDNTGHYSKMYRGKQSLESLIATFDGSTGAEIKSRIRGGKMIDTNSCSESCEAFQ